MDASKTALEEAFRVLGERPGKPVPKTISEPGIPERNDPEPASQTAEPGSLEPSKTSKTVADVDAGDRNGSAAELDQDEIARLLAEPPVESANPADAGSLAPVELTEEPAPPEPELPERDAQVGQIPEPVQPEATNAHLTPVFSYAPTLRERETLKIEGHREAHDDSLPLEQRCRGLLKIIAAHFWASLAAWEFQRRARGGSGEHGYWHQYVSSWLWANSYRTDTPFQGLELVCEALRREYPPERRGIGEGRTYWGTGENHQLRSQCNRPPPPGEDGHD